MQISQVKPTFIIDADQVEEVIHFDVSRNQNGLFYTKYRYLTTDFQGRPILEEDKYIRIKSLWYSDLINEHTEELVPSGSYDIQEIHIAENYVYFVKILDKDGDGLLVEDYNTGAEIWRVNKTHKTLEFCFNCKDKYTHFSFETANDNVVVFRDEDEITELFFVDLLNHRLASLSVSYDDDGNNFDFRFVEDDKNNPTHFVTKKWIFEAEPSSQTHTLNCVKWTELMTQIEWKPY
ncbi:hypothetical protein ACSU64_27225 [Bacillaceae bacterium C204]|uniref:hypothetical protein n=1 Tax=Neobacillus sp. 204 TaxID=3383351 RepID=UPI00397D0BD7